MPRVRLSGCVYPWHFNTTNTSIMKKDDEILGVELPAPDKTTKRLKILVNVITLSWILAVIMALLTVYLFPTAQ